MGSDSSIGNKADGNASANKIGNGKNILSGFGSSLTSDISISYST